MLFTNFLPPPGTLFTIRDQEATNAAVWDATFHVPTVWKREIHAM